MGFEIASSGDCQNSQIGAPAILVPVWVVLWHPKEYQNRWFSKWQVLGTLKTRNFGTAILVPVWVFPTDRFKKYPNPFSKAKTETKKEKHFSLETKTTLSLETGKRETEPKTKTMALVLAMGRVKGVFSHSLIYIAQEAQPRGKHEAERDRGPESTPKSRLPP